MKNMFRAALLVCITTASVQAEPYARINDLGGSRKEFQTAIKTFIHEHQPTINLVAQSHAGLDSYYSDLQNWLDRADLVISEVARDRLKMRESLERCPNYQLAYSASINGLIAHRRGLALVHFSIDDRADKFVNADLPYHELTNDVVGESCKTAACFDDEYKELARRAFAQHDVKTVAELSKSALGPIRSVDIERAGQAETGVLQDFAQMRRVLPERLKREGACKEDEACRKLVEDGVNFVERRIRLAPRNDASFAVLEQRKNEMGLGKAHTIAIFYGSLHMEDFERRLLEQGYKYASEQWITVYDYHVTQGDSETENEEL